MRKILGFIMLAGLVAFTFRPSGADEIVTRSATFAKGERLDYEMYMGFFTVAKGSAVVDQNYHSKNNRTCYKVDAYMQTLGIASWISKVNDNWGAYIDTAEIVTHESYRKLSEGPYRLDELITYDHEKDLAIVKVADKATGKYKEPKVYPTPNNVRDVVTGFLYLRVIDFEKYKKGDTLTVHGFFEDKAYHFKIIYNGRETIKTDIGKIPCFKLVPIMPDNQLFRGENSVTVWISADGNQIPIKVDAKMFIGHAGTELVSFRGLRNQLKVVP
jgi:hypothetical protein